MALNVGGAHHVFVFSVARVVRCWRVIGAGAIVCEKPFRRIPARLSLSEVATDPTHFERHFPFDIDGFFWGLCGKVALSSDIACMHGCDLLHRHGI